MASKTSSYHAALVDSLTDPEEARLYLNAVVEDYPEGLLKALRNVAQARQMTRVAEQAGVKRESLYRALSDSGNPTLDTFWAVLAAVGLRMKFETLADSKTPNPPSSSYAAFLGDFAKGAPHQEKKDTSQEPTPAKILKFEDWGLSSRGQKRVNDRRIEGLEEESNKPELQGALCG